MEDTTKRIVLWASIGVAIILIFGGVWYWRTHTRAARSSGTSALHNQNVANQPNANVSGNGSAGAQPTSQAPTTDTPESQLKRAAIDFVSRFGTYSTDAENENLQQLLPLMGPTLHAWAEAHLAVTPTVPPAFVGYTTKALAAKIISLAGTRAELSVDAQRQVTQGTTKTISYETAHVTLVKQSDTWLVDAITWTKK